MALIYIFVFILGLVTGSFINVCIYRIPGGKSVVTPPSSCTRCNARLKPFDLIPVFSYLFLKGKCRYCGAPISSRYPAVELLTAAVFTALFARFGISAAFPAFAYLLSILIMVFFIDIDHRIIPDGLVITGLAGGAAVFAYNIFKPGEMIFGDDKWWTPLAGILSGSGFLLLIAVIGSLIYKTDEAMGMGDVKLMAPIGVFLGWKMCLAALLISILTAGVISLLLILTGIKKRRDTVPFGPFIVLGTFLTVIWGWDIINRYISLL